MAQQFPEYQNTNKEPHSHKHVYTHIHMQVRTQHCEAAPGSSLIPTPEPRITRKSWHAWYHRSPADQFQMVQ